VGTDIIGGDRHNRWGQTYDQISKCRDPIPKT